MLWYCDYAWDTESPLLFRYRVNADDGIAAEFSVASLTFRAEANVGQFEVLAPDASMVPVVATFQGEPGIAYEARLEISQRGRLVGQFELNGTIPADGRISYRQVLLTRSEERLKMRSARESPMAAIRTHVDDDADYTVFYGTNRARLEPANPAAGYSADRGSGIDYGICRVFVPKSHKIGSIGSPWWKRILTMTDDRLQLLEIRGTDAATHWQEMQQRLAGLGEDDQHAVVFVHGYNVSFTEAAIRAAQIGFDLSIRGPMAFFSWPSQGTLDGYLADAATIEASEDAITSYLSDFAANCGAKNVHVIAHSMGNRGVLRAVQRIAAQAQQRTGVPFSQFILAAADVDADTFRSLASAYRAVARHTTLYVSEKDRAVEASRWLHHFPRVGLAPPVFTTPNVDTIEVTNVDLTQLGHSYVGSAREVLEDMHALIRHGALPAQRFGLREATTPDGHRYWQIGA